MIINNSNNTGVETISGEVNTYSTTIDPKDLDFITTILTTNLYSNPEESFIREIVSNAWDSHVEAGTTDTPVIIKIQNNNILIRDYGTGISPERFKSTFLNIGSSTKRGSNKYIGAYGIGRLSGLACSNTVYFTSYYNGTMYSYVMSKVGNKIEVTKLDEGPTNENNGLSVALINVSDIEKFRNSLGSTVFFPNIYIEDAGFCSRYNSIKSKRFTNFAILDSRVCAKYSILIGNVLYPIDSTILSSDNNNIKDIILFMRDNNIFITFDIGELDITPNRENIIYTTECIDKIRNKLVKAYDEIIELYKLKLEKEYSTIEDLKFLSSTYIYLNLFDNTISTSLSSDCIRIKMSELYNSLSITFKGYSIDEYFIKVARVLLGTQSLEGSYYTVNGMIKRPNLITSKYGGKEFLYTKNTPIYIYPNNVSLRHRMYIAKYNTEALIVKNLNYIFIYKELLNRLYNHGITINNHNSIKCVFQVIYKHLLSRVCSIDENSSSYKEFINQQHSLVKGDSEIILHIPRLVEGNSLIRHSTKFKSLEQFILNINKYSGFIIVNRYKESICEEIRLLKYFKCTVYEASSKLYNTIMKLRNNKIISMEDFMTKSNKVQNYYDRGYLYKSLSDIDNYGFIREVLQRGSKYLRYKFSNSICEVFNKTTENKSYGYLKFLNSKYGIKPSSGINEFIEFVRSILSKIDPEYIFIIHRYSDYWVLNLLIIKSKLFIINYEEYRVTNNNLIYKLVCKKRK